jgi:hypothetical protein
MRVESANLRPAMLEKLNQRPLWPRGVHLAHVVIDGLIAPLHSEGGQPGDEPFLDPDRITDAYWHLATQDRSAWTLELDLRPFTEQFYL